MHKINLSAIILMSVFTFSLAGFLGSELTYNAGHSSVVPFATQYHYKTPYDGFFNPPYPAPLPVAAPVRSHHPYAAIGYSPRPVVRYRGGGGGGFGFSSFTPYAAARFHHKFAFPAAVPSVYDAPPAIDCDAAAVSYNDFEVPNTVVKFGPPITTTTTTYSTTAAAAGIPGPHTLNAVAGW